MKQNVSINGIDKKHVVFQTAHRFDILVVANAKLQIFGDLPKGLSPFLSA